MSKRVKYTDEPLSRVRIVRDVLPRPEELAFREEGVKITLALSRRSVDFFKSEARKHGTQYQRMIRRLLDVYAQAHGEPLPKRSGGRTSVRGART